MPVSSNDRSTADRSLIARIAAAERWGRVQDRAAATLPARQGLRAKFARVVDPDGVLEPDELERRVDSLMRAHMLRMSLAAQKARKGRPGPAGGGSETALPPGPQRSGKNLSGGDDA
jgi:hypothetical protein